MRSWPLTGSKGGTTRCCLLIQRRRSSVVVAWLQCWRWQSSLQSPASSLALCLHACKSKVGGEIGCKCQIGKNGNNLSTPSTPVNIPNSYLSYQLPPEGHLPSVREELQSQGSDCSGESLGPLLGRCGPPCIYSCLLSRGKLPWSLAGQFTGQPWDPPTSTSPCSA